MSAIGGVMRKFFAVAAMLIGLWLLIGGGSVAFFVLTAGQVHPGVLALALVPLLLGGLFLRHGWRKFRPPSEPVDLPADALGAKTKGIIAIAVIGLIVAGGFWFRIANSDLIELAGQRETELKKLRPALLKYRDDTGSFPATLDLLLPNYVVEMPASLVSPAGTEAARKISYRSEGKTATITYHQHRGPDSRMTYVVETGEFIADQ